MELISWKENYSVNNSVIDLQHKRLISYINQLHDAMRQAKGKEVLQKTLNDLIFYTKEHFRSEEGLMEKAGYPQLEQHKIEHKKLTDQVIELQKKYASGKTNLSIDVMIFLKNWLTLHILETDQKYIPFLNN